MRYRRLGKTGLQVAEVGIGTWQLAGDPNCWVDGDLRESLRALDRYVDLGGNFIDTAWIYGYNAEDPEHHHRSHETIGSWLKQRGGRDEVIIASKVAPKNRQWPSFRGNPLEDVFPAAYVRVQVEETLRDLGIETIDLMQFHVWLDAWAEEESWQRVVEDLKREGKVRHWGISINDYQPTQSLKAFETGLIETGQFIFNLFHQAPARELLPYAAEHGIGLIARVPLDEGGLTGKFTQETSWPTDDLRSSYFGGERLQELVERTEALEGLLGEEAQTLTELSLRYILSHPAVSTVIPGMRRVNYVEANTAVSDGRPLSEGLLAELRHHAWERNFYWGLDPALADSGYLDI